jgi:3'-5' exoribonuclease
MKTAYVADLTPEQSITSFFLVCEKEVRSTRDGKAYLRLELGDRTGRVEARMWDRFEESAASISRDDFVKVQARVETYRNRMQLSLDRIRRAEPSELDAADFYCHTEANVDELWTRVRQLAAEIKDSWLCKLVESVLDDPEVSPLLRRAPAAKTMHHAYLGGLLEHIVSLCELCSAVAARYPETNRDLLLTGALLHDIGKVYELSYDRSLGYTNEGQLVGHIVMAVEMIGKKAAAIPGFPVQVATLVKHMILSHHGHYEFGSPKLPMFREAVMLHYLDDLDSKMGAMRVMLNSDRGEPGWTERGGAIERRLLRVEQYIPGKVDAAGAPNVEQDVASPKDNCAGADKKGF